MNINKLILDHSLSYKLHSSSGVGYSHGKVIPTYKLSYVLGFCFKIHALYSLGQAHVEITCILSARNCSPVLRLLRHVA